MEENRESRNKPTHIWSIDFLQKYQGNSMEKAQSFQQMMLDTLHRKKKITTDPYLTPHIKFKMNHRPEFETKTLTFSTGSMGEL